MAWFEDEMRNSRNKEISLSPVRVTPIFSYVIADKRDSLRRIFYHITNSPLRKISACIYNLSG
jgi:hypothetical protein